MTSEVVVAAYVARLAELPLRRFAALVWFALGFSRPEVAKLLGTSVGTVDQYRQLGMRQAGLRVTADLVRRAIREGLIGPDPMPLELDARAWVGGERRGDLYRIELDRRVAQIRARGR